MSRTPHGHRDGRLRRRFRPAVQRLESRELLAATILDPSFETFSVGIGYNAFTTTTPQGSPWTYSNGGGIAGNGSGYTNDNPDAPDGSQVGFIQDFGRISQSITNWDEGTYQVSLLAAQRTQYNDDQNFQVILDGQVITTLTPANTTYRTYTTPLFEVTAGTHTLTLQASNTAMADDTALIDNVSLAQVATTQAVVNDPGFESFAVGAGQYIYDPSGSSWTFSLSSGVSDGSGVSGNNSGFT